jgi:methionyl aminopeptidase
MLSSMCLDLLEAHMRPEHISAGRFTTENIDDFVVRFAKTNNLTCATLGYRGFPASCCTSVNHVACHGIPSKNKLLKEGDIVKVDVTFINQHGYYGDTCRTYKLGEVSRKAEIITSIAREALQIGIDQCLPGNRIGQIGFAIEQFVKKNNASIVREFIGHGIGKIFHDGPDIPHFCQEKNIKKTPELKPGMVFTIEPIVNLGKPKLKILKDKWTAVTIDKSLSAQFEHTIGITDKGCEVLTK